MSYITIFILSYIAGVGFSFIFSVAKRNIPMAALGSGISWTIFQILLDKNMNPIFATLISGIILGLYTELAAKWMKAPALNFVIVGIIPLVPGLKTYQGILWIISEDLAKGAARLFEAIFISIAIGVAILVSSSIARALRSKKQINKQK